MTSSVAHAAGAWASRLRTRPLAAVAILAVVLQLASATWWLKPYVMPNASLEIARNVAASGRFEGGNWQRLKGTTVPTDPPLRSYHLPGEPLYLAAGLAMRQPQVFAYWHVPVTVLLVVATAAVALALFGPDVALATGAIAALDPITVMHGPVYDDTFLSAALLWSVAALLTGRWVRVRRNPSAPVTDRPWYWVALIVAAGWAAITRTETQIALLAAALCCVAVPVLKPLRRPGAAIIGAVLIGVGAWVARNAETLHHVMPGSSHDGLTLWEATEPGASRALAVGQVDALSSDSTLLGPLWHQAMAQDEVGADRVFRRAAIAGILTEPARVGALGLRKAVMSLAGIRPGLPLSAPRNLVSVAATALVALAAGIGLRRAARSRDPTLRVPAAAAALLAVVVLGFLWIGPVGFRYWIAWRPTLWILAGRAVRRV